MTLRFTQNTIWAREVVYKDCYKCWNDELYELFEKMNVSIDLYIAVCRLVYIFGGMVKCQYGVAQAERE